MKVVEKLLDNLKHKRLSKNIKNSLKKSLPEHINFLLYDNVLTEIHYTCKKCKKNMYKKNKTNMIYLQ